MNAQEDEVRIAEQAADWLDAIETGAAASQTAFCAWLKESPRHVGEVLAVSAIYREFAGRDMSHLLEKRSGRAAAADNVIALSRPVTTVRTGSGWRRFSAAAALAAVVVAATWLVYGITAGERYATDIGGRQEITLPDGSVVELNTRSEIRVRFSRTMREIELLSGEAMFEVARDSSRPFRVQSGTTSIQALGTQFNVYRQERGSIVGVIDGAVRIQEKQVLRPGEQATLSADGTITAVAAVAVENIAAWREGRLVFMETPMRDITNEFNRYNRKPQLKVEGAAAARRLTGVFDANAPYSFVRFLEGTRRMEVARAGETILIRDRAGR